jgi:hypothetical protein
MLLKATLLTALISAASLPLVAPAQAGEANAATPAVSSSLPETAREPGKVLVLRPSPDVPGDIFGGRGPNPHSREFREIAIYKSVGNETGVAMVTDELRAEGVSKQIIARNVDQVKVHASPRGSARGRIGEGAKGEPNQY